MKRFLALVLVAASLLAACGGPADDPTLNPGAPPASPTPEAEDERAIAIWAATIRQLVTNDNTFGGGKIPFDHIYVLDRADPDAAQIASGPGPKPSPGEPEPIPPGIQQGIVDELADLPPVEFVSSEDEVLLDQGGCGMVKQNGALLTLGVIPEGENKVEVEMGMFVACLAGTWLTYVVELEGEEWTVTGTTGPIGIS